MVDEQQVADLFSQQLDRLIAGEAAVEIPGTEDLAQLLSLGQQLSRVNFQPGLTAQAIFQSQVNGWFEPTGGGVSGALLGLPKNLFLSIAAAVTGLALVGAAVAGIFLVNSDGHQKSVPASPATPVLVTPEVSTPPAVSPTEATAAPASPATRPVGDSLPGAGAGQSDRLPTAIPSLGDSLPTATSTPNLTPRPTLTITATVSATPGGPGSYSSSDTEDNGEGTTLPGDHDRGHGNDLDGIDEDNPGNSSGVGGGNNNSNDGQSGGNSGGSRGGGKKD